jgi:hypothetical protein
VSGNAYAQLEFEDNSSLVNFTGAHDSVQLYQDIIDGGDVFDGSVTPVPTSATPEPSTLALFGTGIIGLAGMARRKFLPQS